MEGVGDHDVIAEATYVRDIGISLLVEKDQDVLAGL